MAVRGVAVVELTVEGLAVEGLAAGRGVGERGAVVRLAVLGLAVGGLADGRVAVGRGSGETGSVGVAVGRGSGETGSVGVAVRLEEGRGLGVRWSGQRHLFAEYRPMPLHLQSKWQLTLQAGSLHVSLLAPSRMFLPQNLQLDRGRGSGRLGGGGAGDLVPTCWGQSQVMADLVYRLTLLHFSWRWQRRGQTGAPHARCLAPALMAVPHALHFTTAGGAGAGERPALGDAGTGGGQWEGHLQVVFGALPRPLHFLPMWHMFRQEGTAHARLLTPVPMVREQVWQAARLEGDLGGGFGRGPGFGSTSPARRSSRGSKGLSWGIRSWGLGGGTSPAGEAVELGGRRTTPEVGLAGLGGGKEGVTSPGEGEAGDLLGGWLASGEFGGGGLAGGPPLKKKGAPQ